MFVRPQEKCDCHYIDIQETHSLQKYFVKNHCTDFMEVRQFL